ncbi:MAG TPA: tyrosine-type recombinase/integrase [Conexibacter sp.]|jgi:integrase|nr:tyrosine-type recombinase/integrase [Conexibacter sp.]
MPATTDIPPARPARRRRRDDARRSHGTGSLSVRADRNGRETYYGSWYANGRRVKRRVGPKRPRGERAGLTRAQAEAELRRLIAETQVRAQVGERLTIGEVGARYVEHAKRRGRKVSTQKSIESIVRVHLVPFFGEQPVDAIEPEDVIDLVALLERNRRAPATVRVVIATLSALFVFAKAPYRRWATFNPCEGIELPAIPEPTEIRYLTLPQIDKLIAHVRPGPFAHLDRAIFITAVMTGLRKGELVALRWRDVDWEARRVRVRRSYTYGEFSTPKSRRSSRSVPMTAELAIELRRLWNQTIWRDDDDLVFAHPDTGGIVPKANISRRLSAALRAAGIEDHRFHDLRHTFGTRMAAAGVPLRTLQEWLGHRDITTTQRYADYAPSEHEGEMVEAAFQRATRATDRRRLEAV